LNKHLLKQSGNVARQLRKLNLRAKTITLKLKHTDFKQVTRSTTLDVPIQSSDRIFVEASQLLADYPLTKQVRLIGVGVSGMVSSEVPIQLELFDQTQYKNKHWEKLDQTLDTIAHKFGKNAVRRASLGKKKPTS
jgi:DNA polymerase-4